MRSIAQSRSIAGELPETIEPDPVEQYLYAVPVVPADDELPVADLTSAIETIQTLSSP